MRRRLFGVFLLTQLALAQTATSTQIKLPCAYSGAVLRDDSGRIVAATSAQLKTRATRKEDVSVSLLGRVDFKATFAYDVLIGPAGNIICLKRTKGFPAADAEVEKAVRQWKFTPAEKNGKSIASVGTLEFYLCNMNCGAEGRSSSLLN